MTEDPARLQQWRDNAARYYAEHKDAVRRRQVLYYLNGNRSRRPTHQSVLKYDLVYSVAEGRWT